MLWTAFKGSVRCVGVAGQRLPYHEEPLAEVCDLRHRSSELLLLPVKFVCAAQAAHHAADVRNS